MHIKLDGCHSIFVDREKKGHAAFRRLFFRAAPRRSCKTGTERLPERTGEACPYGEDWSGEVVRLPQGLWRVQYYLVGRKKIIV